jgi:hypothetical protein
LIPIVPATLAATPALPPITTPYAHRLAVVAGVLEDIQRDDEDNGNDGYEDADDAAFWSIVRTAQDDACPLCGYWTCRCTSGLAPVARTVLSPAGAGGQCSV